MENDWRYAVSKIVGRGRGGEQRIRIVSPWTVHKVLAQEALREWQRLDTAGVYGLMEARNLAAVVALDTR